MRVLTIALHTFLELRAKVTLIILAAISILVLLGVALSLSAAETAEGVTLMRPMPWQRSSPRSRRHWPAGS